MYGFFVHFSNYKYNVRRTKINNLIPQHWQKWVSGVRWILETSSFCIKLIKQEINTFEVETKMTGRGYLKERACAWPLQQRWLPFIISSSVLIDRSFSAPGGHASPAPHFMNPTAATSNSYLSPNVPGFSSLTPCTFLPQGSILPTPWGCSTTWVGVQVGHCILSPLSFIAQHVTRFHICFVPAPQGPQSQEVLFLFWGSLTWWLWAKAWESADASGLCPLRTEWPLDLTQPHWAPGYPYVEWEYTSMQAMGGLQR